MTRKIASPRLPVLNLDNLRADERPVIRRGDRHDGMAYSGLRLDGQELDGADFSECRFDSVSMNETQLRGAGFKDSLLAELYAPVFSAPRSTWREVLLTNPRLGSAEVYESGWQSVRIDGGKIDYLNLRGSKLTDVLISDCIINELDLGSATAARVSLSNCTIGTLDITGARLRDFDLRGSEFRGINGLGSLAGVVIDRDQLDSLAGLMAQHLGVVVA
ncbi:pentapeptide repeat-containing protein [Pseudarthrobacter sp. PS3-L1]|uniref:pentapeptide repeat-containing protein n=1 Tax=Pseudarthrobacter sp. PS3-L1 TaxID=3046207 RepID=UPI0024BB90B2|nr:pentapeptide repeat-containing protein [Pseudarthrobacter sp. PS3-L1]MDJ0319296.1 pentapeptide repeat-containing protein [Pseudarthrobacter sp. PS3-L1]